MTKLNVFLKIVIFYFAAFNFSWASISELLVYVVPKNYQNDRNVFKAIEDLITENFSHEDVDRALNWASLIGLPEFAPQKYFYFDFYDNLIKKLNPNDQIDFKNLITPVLLNKKTNKKISHIKIILLPNFNKINNFLRLLIQDENRELTKKIREQIFAEKFSDHQLNQLLELGQIIGKISTNEENLYNAIMSFCGVIKQLPPSFQSDFIKYMASHLESTALEDKIELAKSLALHFPLHLEKSILADLPTENYHRKNIQDQCKDYRQIFDKIFHHLASFGSTGPNLWMKMSTESAPELLSILKDGVLIVRDYILSNQIGDFYRRLEHLNFLKEFWQVAQKSSLTATNFATLNQVLALLVSNYKNENIQTGINSTNTNFSWAIKIIKESSLKELRYSDLNRFFELNRPIFILYAHPDKGVLGRGLSPSTFVREYAGNVPFPGYLALFDVHSDQRKIPIKKDPHWSKENGTFKMLWHDLRHINDISSKETEAAYNAIRAGEKFSLKLPESRLDDKRVIDNGLFYLFHEQELLPLKRLPAENNPLKNLTIAAEDEQKQAAGYLTLGERLGEFFKQERRDKEKVLLTLKDENQKPFLPVIEMSDGIERALPIAKKGDTYIIIENSKEFVDGMTWVAKNVDAPKAIRLDRDRLLLPLLEEAFQKYWARFKDLIKEAM